MQPFGRPGSLAQLSFDMSIKAPGMNAQVAQISRAIQQLSIQIAGLSGGMRDLARSYARTRTESKKTQTTAEKLGKAWKALQARLRQFLVVVGSFIVLRRWLRIFAEFETRMAEVNTIAGESITKMEKLRNGVLNLAKSMPQSASDLGSGLYQVLSAGVTDTADALLVLRASATAATAGLTDTRTSVDAVTTVLNAYQKQASEASAVTDVLFKTVELGKVTFPELAQNIGNVATSAALAGVSIEEVGAGIATLTKFGVNAAEATTSLNRLFLTLTSKSKEQAAAFKSLGVNFDVATVRSKGFVGLLQELNKLTDEQIDKLAELFPNIRAARAAFVLAGKGTAEYTRILGLTRDSQGAAQRAADKMNNTLTNQAKILAGNVNVLFQELANKILPELTEALRYFNELFLSESERALRRAERLGLTLHKQSLERQVALEEDRKLLEDIDKSIRKMAVTSQKYVLGTSQAFSSIVGELIKNAAFLQTGITGARGLGSYREAAKAIKDMRVEQLALRESLHGEREIRTEIIRLQKLSAEIADQQATATPEENKFLEVRQQQIEENLKILEKTYRLQQDRLSLQIEVEQLTDRGFQAQKRELGVQEQLLELLKQNAANEKEGSKARLQYEQEILEVRQRIAALKTDIELRKNVDAARSLAVALGHAYEQYAQASDEVGKQEAIVASVRGETERLARVREGIIKRTDLETNEIEKQVDLIKADEQTLAVLLAYHELILKLLKQQNEEREGAIAQQEELNALTEDQANFLRKLRSIIAEEGGRLDLLQQFKFDDLVRGFAEAFKIELSGDPLKVIGANFADAIEKGAVERLGETKAKDVLDMFAQIWQSWVVDFNPGEKLVDRINEAIAQLRGGESLEEKIQKPIRKVREEFEKLKPALDDVKKAKIEELFREWERAARQAELDKIVKKFTDQFDSLTIKPAVKALQDFELEVTRIESTVSNLTPAYIDARDALRDYLRSAEALEGHKDDLQDIRDALSLRELEIEATVSDEAEARQLRLQAYEEARTKAIEKRASIEQDATLTDEQRAEALDDAYRLYLEILRTIREILGAKEEGLKADKDELELLRKQLRNLQAMLGLINQAVEGILSLLDATGAVGENFIKAANAIRQMGVGVATLITNLDVLGKVGDQIEGLKNTISDLENVAQKTADQINQLNDAKKALESAQGLKLETVGGILSGGLGIAGGLASLVGAIGGLFGESPEEKERKQRIKENTRALYELKTSVHELAGTFKISGQDFTSGLKALREQAATGAGFTGIFGGVNLRLFRERLAELGLSFKDLDRIAEEMGVTIRDSAGNLTKDGLEALVEAMEDVKDYFIGFPDTIEGVMQEARFTTDIFDLEDPQLQLAAMIAGLVGAGDDFTRWLLDMEAQGRDATAALGEWQAGLQGMLATFGDDILKIPALADLFTLDLTTAEGRAQAEQLIKELFRQFQLGQLDIEALGFTAPQEFLDFISGIEGLLDQIDETAGTLGTTQDVRRQVSITELQANQLLAYQATMTEIQRRIEGILVQIRDSLVTFGGAPTTGFEPINIPPIPITASELAAYPDFQRILDGLEPTVNVDVDMTIERVILDGGTEDQARAFATTATDEIRRQLGEAYRKNRRLKGLQE